jgi:hypothetical protein
MPSSVSSQRFPGLREDRFPAPRVSLAVTLTAETLHGPHIPTFSTRKLTYWTDEAEKRLARLLLASRTPVPAKTSILPKAGVGPDVKITVSLFRLQTSPLQNL